MTRRLTMAQVACGIVAGVGIALGATAGLVLAASLYHGGSGAVPIVAASKAGARAPARQPNAVAAVDESGRSAAAPAKKAAAKRATRTRKRASPSHRRAAHVKKRSASTPATILVRQTAPAPATTAPTRQLAQTAPVATPTPARTTPSKPSAEPTRSASGSGTFDDSG
jgi:hypothetical protein